MLIKDINKENRPIEKMIKYGPEVLTCEELLAILINTGSKGISSLEISTNIINDLSDLSELLNYSIFELMKYEGIKESKACRIEAAIELTRRLIYHHKEQKNLHSSDVAASYLYPLFSRYQTEHLIVLYLNAKCKIIRTQNIIGGGRSVDIPINEILRCSLKYNAAGVIISHNHPSGDPSPSQSDIKATNELIEKLHEFDFLLFDHIIIGNKKYYSFSDDKIGIINE